MQWGIELKNCDCWSRLWKTFIFVLKLQFHKFYRLGVEFSASYETSSANYLPILLSSESFSLSPSQSFFGAWFFDKGVIEIVFAYCASVILSTSLLFISLSVMSSVCILITCVLFLPEWLSSHAKSEYRSSSTVSLFLTDFFSDVDLNEIFCIDAFIEAVTWSSSCASMMLLPCFVDVYSVALLIWT